MATDLAASVLTDLSAAAAPDLYGIAGDLASSPPRDLAAISGSDLAQAGPYPPGPYGNREGDRITNLEWIGYVNDAADAVSTTKPYVAYSMDAARKSGKRYALIHVSEFI